MVTDMAGRFLRCDSMPWYEYPSAETQAFGASGSWSSFSFVERVSRSLNSWRGSGANASGSLGVTADGETASDRGLPSALRGLAVRLRRPDLKLVILLQNVVGLADSELARSVLMEETEETSEPVGNLAFVGDLCGTRVIVFVERPSLLMRTAWHDRRFP
jgi:hypothetical protein